MRRFDIAVFEGDGIGPEVMRPTVDLLDALAGAGGDYLLAFERLAAGAGHYRDHGTSLPAASLDRARAADAILLSAMGLPEVRYRDGTEISPQIELRMALGLYAGVRPVFQFGQTCPLSRFNSKERDVDFVIVRESTEGLFYSHGRGSVSGDSVAEETLRITRATSEKLFDFAFDLARQRRADGRGTGVVHCVDKANVFQAFAFFRKIFRERAQAFPDIRAEAAYVDATAMWMVEKPGMFDVLVTENMFGDILSDLGAAMMGGLGLAPSADIGDRHAVFQPCHGSAPDIAGQARANPIAMVLSAAMMLDWLGRTQAHPGLRRDARRVQDAVGAVVRQGRPLTPDIGGQATTDEVVAAVRDAALAMIPA
jgi:3-isopropylmalate dehydrogenase